MEYYFWIKAFHIIAIISWMAGILYLYRLLIYASEQGYDHEKVYSLLKTMSRRLQNAITIPAMVLSWVLGLTMVALNTSVLNHGWFYLKLFSVLLLTASTGYAAHLVKRYHVGEKPLPTSRNLRFLNEVPTLLMVIIVCAVVVKPILSLF